MGLALYLTLSGTELSFLVLAIIALFLIIVIWSYTA